MKQAEAALDGILVDLDCLLDMRFAVLSSIDEVKASELLRTDEYFTRNADVFSGFDEANYRGVYSKRNTEHLQYAIMTNSSEMMLKLVKDLRLQATSTPYTDGSHLVINTYPYRLTDEATQELVDCVYIHTQGLVEVSAIHMPPEEITPQYVKAHFSMLIVYEYDQWLELHYKELVKTPLTEIIMCAPAILSQHLSVDQINRIIIEHLVHPIDAKQIAASPMITLRLIDVRYFCMLNAK